MYLGFDKIAHVATCHIGRCLLPDSTIVTSNGEQSPEAALNFFETRQIKISWARARGLKTHITVFSQSDPVPSKFSISICFDAKNISFSDVFPKKIH